MNRAEALMAGLAPDQVKVSKADLSRIWGVSKSAVTQIFRNPQAPLFDEKGKIRLCDANRYYATVSKNAAKRVSGAVEQNAEDMMSIQEAKRRQAVSEMRLSQIRVAEAEGRLVSIDEVRRIAASDASIIATTLRGWPTKIAAELTDAAKAGGIIAVGSLLDRYVRNVLADWSSGMEAEERQDAFCEEAARGSD